MENSAALIAVRSKRGLFILIPNLYFHLESNNYFDNNQLSGGIEVAQSAKHKTENDLLVVVSVIAHFSLSHRARAKVLVGIKRSIKVNLYPTHSPLEHAATPIKTF